jgi:hypothetical protein
LNAPFQDFARPVRAVDTITASVTVYSSMISIGDGRVTPALN